MSRVLKRLVHVFKRLSSLLMDFKIKFSSYMLKTLTFPTGLLCAPPTQLF